MQSRKIVVATDFSEEAEVALRQALRVARTIDAEIVLLHVCDVVQPIPPAIPANHAAFQSFYEIAQQQVKIARARLEQIRERIHGQGVDVSHMIIEGFPDTGICEAAVDLDARLIVTGTRGLTGVKRFILGSVAERAVRLSELDVLVARKAAERIPSAGGFHDVLVPVDFSQASQRTLPLALSMTAPEGRVQVVHVLERAYPLMGYEDALVGPSVDFGALWETAVVEARSRCEEMVATHVREGGPTITQDIIEGSPAFAIQEHLDRGTYDLVVMGSHGRRGFRRALLGSVAERTVRHAPCSVLIARSPTGAAG